MPASAQPAPVYRRTAPRDAPALARFAGMAFGAAWSEAFVRWKYFENPAGPVFGACAEIEGQPAAYYGNIPVRLKLGDQVVLGAQAVDAMVAPEARRRRLFVALGRETFHQMDEAGVALAYAFPNDISRTAFVERMAWVPIGTVPRYVRVLDAPALARAGGRKGPAAWLYALWLRAFAGRERASAGPEDGLTLGPAAQFDARFDDLWAAVSDAFPAAVERSAAYLNWRYARHPAAQYMILTARRGEVLAGFAVLSTRDAPAAGVVALTELLVAPGDRAAGRALLAECARLARLARGAQIQCWLLPQHGFYRELLQESGFVYRPGRAAPRALGYATWFIVRPHPAQRLPIDPAVQANWYLSAGDYDYF